MKKFTTLCVVWMMALALPSFAQTTISWETFPNTFNLGAKRPIDSLFQGDIGLWRAYSSDSMSTVIVNAGVLKLYNWAAGTCHLTGPSSNRVTSPVINCHTACVGSGKITFDLYTHTVNPNSTCFKLLLKVSGDGGATWTTLLSETAQSLNATYGQGTWHNISLTIPTSLITSNFRYQFAGIEDQTCMYENFLYIDNVKIITTPCLPANLNLGNLIWNDKNLNNVRDSLEPAIANATVKLYKDDNNDNMADGAAIATTTTDANGKYNFTGLTPGNYIVGVIIPVGNVRGPNSTVDPDNNVDNDNNGVYLFGDNQPGSEVRSKAITLAAGTEPTNDGDGNNGNLTLDIALCEPAQPTTGQQCYGISNPGCISCNLRYPDSSNLPRSAVAFSESDVLRYAEPGPSTCGSATSEIHMYYNDEHAMTLGVRRVIVKTSGGITTTDYPVTATPSSPMCVSNPQVGTTAMTGDQSGNDVAAGGGRPLWPALFITDLTVNGMMSRAGDWQQGGTGIAPHKVCGTWKAAVRTVDYTKTPAEVKVTPDADPAKDNWNLGTGSNVPDVGFSPFKNEGYGAEVVWNISQLGLIAGHTYRLQFMVHDGDQNKAGGDAGEACTTIIMGGAPTPATDGTVKATWTINNDSTVTIRTTIAKTLVDNTYGTNAMGYPSTHKFTDMVNTDNMELALYDAAGQKKMDFTMDYLSANNSAPSHYSTLGISGGNGSLAMGNASDVVSVRTSLDSNLNARGYVLTTNSPATNSSYTPNSAYPNWDFNVSYTATVKLSAFGAAGFGYPQVIKLNATPNKLGTNSDVMFTPTNCPATHKFADVLAATRKTEPATFRAALYPNPAYSYATVTVEASATDKAVVTIVDASGKVVYTKTQLVNTGFNQISLNTLDKLTSGVYTVKINMHNSVVTRQMMISR